MHQPSMSPRPSIYYPYQVHAAWTPGAGQARESLQQVVIAGNGPAGMVTALELARHGVPSVILTAECQFTQGSRAIVFTRRSLEILQQVGVADRLMAAGLPWRFGNSYYRGQQVFRMEAPKSDDDRFWPMLNIQQQYLEEYLHEACVATGLIEVRWGNKVTGVNQLADQVRVQVDTPAGEYELPTQWLVAADGGRSVVRNLLGLGMEGTSYEGHFVIADIRVDLPLPTERLAFFDPPWNPGNTVLMHREPHGIWRVDYQLPKGESPEEALKPERLTERINAQLAMIGHAGVAWELDWSSVYSARTLTLSDYWHQRVLFVGDAAHLLPIFGVRGANTAFQDAQSLGWHLAWVCRGLARPGLLANFSAERVGAAREIIAEAGKSVRFMAPPGWGHECVRNAVLSLSLTQAFVRPLYHWRTSRPHEYTHSVLNAVDDDNAVFESGPAQGAAPINVRLSPDSFLLDHLGGGFDLLWFSDEALPPALSAEITAWRTQGWPIRVVALGQRQVPVPGADLSLHDASGQARRRYGVLEEGACYLLRPDQHVCARWQRLDAHRLRRALARINPEPLA